VAPTAIAIVEELDAESEDAVRQAVAVPLDRTDQPAVRL
jgi:hypothetical protein